MQTFKLVIQKLIYFFTVILAIGITIALLQSLFLGYFTSIPQVELPDLTGMPAEEALYDLDNMGLRGKITTKVINPSIPADHVVTQLPEAGRTVKKDRIVKLVVSKGVGEAKIPEIIGRSLSQAKEILSKNDLNISVTRIEYNTDIQKNFIIEQQPDPEVIALKNSTINVVISGGYPITMGYLEKDDKNSNFEIILFIPENWNEQNIKVVLTDYRGTHTLFENLLKPGDMKALQHRSENTSLVEIYFNNELAHKQSLMELERSARAGDTETENN